MPASARFIPSRRSHESALAQAGSATSLSGWRTGADGQPRSKETNMTCFKQSMAAALLALGLAPLSFAQTVQTDLEGFQEVPVVSTEGSGTLRLKIDADGQSIFYELEFGNLGAPVTQAHIHLGQRSFNGGIAVWLCGTTGTLVGPPGTPTCPVSGGTVSGTIIPASVIGPGGAQQLNAGEFDEFLRALRAGKTYANVHTTVSPGGEIRGQIKGNNGQGHDH
jgi:hypothetical protein